VKAFAGAAHMATKVFSSPDYRNFIMSKLFDASMIDDDTILESTMEALDVIASNCYDYISEYIEKIGEITNRLLQSSHDLAAKLVLEIWSTIAETERKRALQGGAVHGII
jgi:hypothetical protein